MIVTKTPLIRQYGKGLGFHYQVGGNIFIDTFKALGRKLGRWGLMGLKALRPKAIELGKKGLEIGKDIFQENKKNIQNIISNQTKKGFQDLIDKKSLKEIYKQTVADTKQNVKGIVNRAKTRVTEESKNILRNLIQEGDGFKK